MKFTVLLFFLIFGTNNYVFAQFRIEAENIDGKSISLESLLKKGPVLVNFWATWCQPCKAEMKHLKQFYDDYSTQGFSIIGINLDSPKSVSKVKSFVSSASVNYPIILDPNGKIFESFNGQVMPFNLLIDQQGNIAYKSTGYLPGDEDKLKSEILKLIQSK